MCSCVAREGVLVLIVPCRGFFCVRHVPGPGAFCVRYMRVCLCCCVFAVHVHVHAYAHVNVHVLPGTYVCWCFDLCSFFEHADMGKITIDGAGTTNEEIGPLRYTVQTGRSARDRMRERLLKRLHEDFPQTEVGIMVMVLFFFFMCCEGRDERDPPPPSIHPQPQLRYQFCFLLAGVFRQRGKGTKNQQHIE